MIFTDDYFNQREAEIFKEVFSDAHKRNEPNKCAKAKKIDRQEANKHLIKLFEEVINHDK